MPPGHTSSFPRIGNKQAQRGYDLGWNTQLTQEAAGAGILSSDFGHYALSVPLATWSSIQQMHGSSRLRCLYYAWLWSHFRRRESHGTPGTSTDGHPIHPVRGHLPRSNFIVLRASPPRDEWLPVNLSTSSLNNPWQPINTRPKQEKPSKTTLETKIKAVEAVREHKQS